MRNTITLILLIFCSLTCVYADNLFQTNNPFPQTVPQTMNNIYETEPSVMTKEFNMEKKNKLRKKTKQNKQSDFNAETNNMKIPVYPVQYDENRENGNFYMFTTGQ